jgi:antitoxin (DNA-binding transcriptional repressor) of toxin-antitoxin stability system
MKEVALSEVKDDLSRYLCQAAKEEIVITRHIRKPAARSCGMGCAERYGALVLS